MNIINNLIVPLLYAISYLWFIAYILTDTQVLRSAEISWKNLENLPSFSALEVQAAAFKLIDDPPKITKLPDQICVTKHNNLGIVLGWLQSETNSSGESS